MEHYDPYQRPSAGEALRCLQAIIDYLPVELCNLSFTGSLRCFTRILLLNAGCRSMELSNSQTGSDATIVLIVVIVRRVG